MPEKAAVTKSSQSLVNIDGAVLAEPVRLLVERACDAVGGWLRPWQIRRVGAAEADVKRLSADAEADAKLALVKADIQISVHQRRALQRLAVEEEDKQRNMESITAAALPLVNPDAQPQKIERDWLVNFFDKSRLTSDAEMQQLWAKILAGEANAPGKFSKRTVNLLADLDKSDAEQFQTLCRFKWGIGGTAYPVVFNTETEIYQKNGLSFGTVSHLSEIGLISFEPVSGFTVLSHPSATGAEWFLSLIMTGYGGRHVAIYPPDRRLHVGLVKLSRAGADLERICGARPVDGFFDFCVAEWSRRGAKVKEMVTGESMHPGDFGLV